MLDFWHNKCLYNELFAGPPEQIGGMFPTKFFQTFIFPLPIKGQWISKANYGFKTSPKKQTKLTILEDYYLKGNTKRESMFFLQKAQDSELGSFWEEVLEP